jgi:hypothetical protein
MRLGDLTGEAGPSMQQDWGFEHQFTSPGVPRARVEASRQGDCFFPSALKFGWRGKIPSVLTGVNAATIAEAQLLYPETTSRDAAAILR